MFIGKKVLNATGYKLDDHDMLIGQKLTDIKTWGKHLLICFKKFTVRVHYGLFGSYRVNDERLGKNASLALHFANGNFNSYVASAKIIDEDINELYDWRLDMLSPDWDPKFVKKKVLEQGGDKEIGDILLNANIFSGVGNIIRNEVLYRVKLHPGSTLASIPARKLTAMIKETQVYSYDFLKWRRINQLMKHWEIYAKKKCPKGHEVIKEYTGKTKRRSFICACMEKF